MSALDQLDVFAGELSLERAQLGPQEWEGVLRRAAEPELRLRALKLDDNDFGGQAGQVLGEWVGKLAHLAELSVCNARLSGDAASQLFLSLEAIPAFARTHAEVIAPVEIAGVHAKQGARLCLMHNDLADADLRCGRAEPPRLAGVVDLALSGNLRLSDFAALAQLAPNACRLYLSGTGITGTDAVGVLDKAWPFLDALALSNTPMEAAGFEALYKSILKRAEPYEKKQKMMPVDKPVHPYCHLDLRGIPTLPPLLLDKLAERYRLFSIAHKSMDLPWLHRQHFSSGSKTIRDGLVLRHDFETTCTVRLQVHTVGAASGAAPQANGVYHAELGDVPRKLSLQELVSGVVQAVNYNRNDPG